MQTCPTCCGRHMKLRSQADRFIECWCEACDDVVFVKKQAEM